MDGSNVHDTNKLFPDPPLGVYGGACGDTLEIRKDSVVFGKYDAFTKYRRSVEVRYEELTDAAFQPSVGFNTGILSVRSRMNEEMPFPDKEIAAGLDPTSMLFLTEHSHIFCVLYEFFQKCIDAANRCPRKITKTEQQPPIGVYKGVGGHLELTEDSVIFRHSRLLGIRASYRVAYDDVVKVVLEKPTFWRNGSLKLKCWQDRFAKFEDFTCVDTSLCFQDRYLKDFQKVYAFLEKCGHNKTEE